MDPWPERKLTVDVIWATNAYEISYAMRMIRVYDTQAAKRPVNLTMNGDLVERARAEGLNLSALAEGAVATELARRARERWDAEITEACAAHERYLEEYGSASDLLRAHLEAEGGHDATE
jgi:antitoxin CcdA